MGDFFKASFYHGDPFNIAIGAEFQHRFSARNNTLTLGAQYLFNSSTLVKAHVDTNGIVYARIKHSIVTVSGEISLRGDQAPELG